MSYIRNTLLMFMLSGAGTYAGLNKLEAISMIESGNNDRAVGGAGEVSRFQIKPNVWRTISASMAWRDVSVSRLVAESYLSRLEDGFRRRAGREPSDFDIYVLWNAGPAYYERVGFLPGRVASIVRERAQRYVNLRRMPNQDAAPYSDRTVTVTSVRPSRIAPPFAMAGFGMTGIAP